jgi:hypothetical protein
MGVQSKFSSREMFGPVFLSLVIKETKILLYFLVLVLNFAIFFKMIDSSEASFDTKMLIESTYELGCKLWAVIGQDFLWDFMKMEDILIVKISSVLGY